MIRPKRLEGTTLQNLRRRILQQEPLCRHCMQRGHVTEALEVDHIIPLHKWTDPNKNPHADSNLQPLCKDCHTKKSIEERGMLQRKRKINIDGWDDDES